MHDQLRSYEGTTNCEIVKTRNQDWKQVIDSSGSPLEKHICFSVIIKYFNYPVIFPNLLAASLLAVEVLTSWSRNAWLHRCQGKWKYQKMFYMPLLKLPFEAITSATHLLFAHTFPDYYVSPNEMGRHIVFSSVVCLSVRPSVRLSVRPSVTLRVRSISFEPLVGFTNNFAQMSSMMRRCAVSMFDQGWVKVKVTI